MKRIGLVFLILFALMFSNSGAKGLMPGNDVSRFKSVAASDSVGPQHRVHRRGNINLCISNWGYIGSMSRDIYESPGCLFCDNPDREVIAPSFEFPSNSGLEYLYQGALWIGGVVEDETLVSVGADGWWWIYEWAPVSGIIEKELLADQECVAIFTDTVIPPPLTQWPESTDWDQREHKPLYLEVTQKSYSWQSHPFNDFIILDYTIRNVGCRFLSDVYLGFYLDTDIYSISEIPYAPT
jgi:hypothetical protein